jgi:hypothetical protein
MPNTTCISCDIASTDYSCELGLEIWLNDQQLLNMDHVQESYEFRHEISDDTQDHELKFLLKNKLPIHTKVDKDNCILQDACVCITNLQFDGIPMGQIFFDLALYEHNHNGTGPAIQDRFYGQMGCNGAVTFKFSTPIYMWLLENM